MAKKVASYALLMQEARKAGVDKNQLFKAAAKTYDTQAKRKSDIEAEIEEKGLFVEKTYVKGAANLTANPMLDQLRSLEDSMNRTLGEMESLIKTFGKPPEEPDDGLGEFRA